MKIDRYQDDLTDISAKTHALVSMCVCVRRAAHEVWMFQWVCPVLWLWLWVFEVMLRVSSASVFKLKNMFFGCFDPEKFFLDKENYNFSGWPNRYFGLKRSTAREVRFTLRSCGCDCTAVHVYVYIVVNCVGEAHFALCFPLYFLLRMAF